MIQVKHLCKQYPNIASPVFKALNFSLDAGKSMALCGQSGSGKSTLIGLLCGLDTPTSGEIILKDIPFHLLSLTEKSDFRAQHMGLVFQQITLVSYLTVIENITLPSLYTKKTIALSEVDHYLDQLHLHSVKTKLPHELSIGQAQRICLIRTLVSHPKIILADEPTGALDPPNAALIFNLLAEYCQTNQASALIATHDWSLAQQCDHQLWLSPKAHP